MSYLKRAALCALISLGAFAAAAETIHSQDVYLRYTLTDASIFAAAGGPLVVYGAPSTGARAEEIAADMRLPSYLAQRDVTATSPDYTGYRLVLVFAPQAGLSGRSVCKGNAKGGVAGAQTKMLGVFCRGESTILSEATLLADGAFGPGQPGFSQAMSRLMRELMPLRSPFDQGERGCRRSC